MIHVFTRTWWKKNPSWPNGLEPHKGRKHTLAQVHSEEEARSICEEWNNTHDPGKLSRMAEFLRE